MATAFTIESERVRTSTLRPRIKYAPVDKKIVIEDCDTYSIEVIRPLQKRQHYPTIIYIPGTAFCMDESFHTDMICSQIAYKSQYQILIVRHPLAPENPYPQALNSLEDSIVKLLLYKADDYKIDQSKLLLMGYSSGGNLAAALAPILLKQGLLFNTLYLISPILDCTRSLTDYKEVYEDQDKILSEDFVSWCQNLYIADQIDRKNPNISPYWIDEVDMKYLPRVELFYGQFDRFRSDAEGYYQKLRQHNVVINKHMISQGDHSYLWLDLNAIKRIANNIRDLHWFV